ncbi:MAG TPA: hypothetical protein VMU26_16970 [Candidatus Polarisedimenticolia bacterium]|nr:hypothetical protein [Candidatus Polarisedimenticolia bacterium]
MTPARPQPVTTTNPSGVLSTRDWSSGIVSSTKPAEVCTFPVLLQLCSGYLRGTGPVSQAPGHVGDMNYRECARISIHHFPAESHQAD